MCLTVEPESPQEIEESLSHDCAVKFSTVTDVPVLPPNQKNTAVVVAISTIIAIGMLLLLVISTPICTVVCCNKRKVKLLKDSVTAGTIINHDHHVILHHDNQFDALNNRRARTDLVDSNHSYVINSLGGHSVREHNRSHLVQSSHSYVIQSLGQSSNSRADEELYWPPASKEGDLKQQLKKSKVNEVHRNDIE